METGSNAGKEVFKIALAAMMSLNDFKTFQKKISGFIKN